MMTDNQMLAYSDGDIDTNRSNNPSLESIVAARYSRRQTLFGSAQATAAALFGGMIVAACGGDSDPAPTVSAGSSVDTRSGRVVTLNGTAVDAVGIGSQTWTQVTGPTVTLTTVSPTSVSFIAPSVTAPTLFVFRYTAVDTRGQSASSDAIVTVSAAELGFVAVGKSLADRVTVPSGYSVTVLYRLGDPITAATSAYANNGTDGNFGQRAGDHHDALYYYGLAATGTAPDPNNNTRGLLVINHENITQRYLHPNGATSVGGVRPEAEVIKEMEAHGLSVVEVTRAPANGAWSYLQGSAFNRRITPLTPMAFNGPVRGSGLIQTAFSPTGVAGRGTINNCANGFTQWGTNLTCEENWAGYFRRRSPTDDPRRTAREIVALNRYSVGGGPLGGGAYSWFSVVPAMATNTIYARWTAEVSGATATADFRNEANQFG